MRSKTVLMAAVAAGCSAFAAGSALAMIPASPHTLAAKDARIAKQVRHELARDFPGSHYQMSVTAQGNGIVVLTGTMDSDFSEATALRDAHKVPGVTAVENHLQVVA